MPTTRERIIKKVTITTLSLATLGIVGGAAATLVADDHASAEKSNQTSWNHGNDQQDGMLRASMDPALIIEAFESYMARPHIMGDTMQPGTDATGIDQMKVEDLKISGNNALGTVNSMDNAFVFLAVKTNDKWDVVYVGNGGLDPALSEKYKIPHEWLQ